MFKNREGPKSTSDTGVSLSLLPGARAEVLPVVMSGGDGHLEGRHEAAGSTVSCPFSVLGGLH